METSPYLADPEAPPRLREPIPARNPRLIQFEFVYLLVSPRARGLSIDINLNPHVSVDLDIMAAELKKTLGFVWAGRLRERPWCRSIPSEFLSLRHVAIGGDDEPTLAQNFADAVRESVHVRAMSGFPFKLVLVTNATGLDQPHVQQGLKYFTQSDEIWAKLNGGTQAYLAKVDGLDAPLDTILDNILLLAWQRPVIIQSLFPAVDGQEPPLEEIQQYASRLKELKLRGAQIPLVQIYSATWATPGSRCSHLTLKTLAGIAQTVRTVAGLKAEVF